MPLDGRSKNNFADQLCELRDDPCAQVAAEATGLRYLVPDVKASCERAIKDEGHVFSNALRGALPAADWLDPVLFAWSACYLFIANRRVYGAGVLKAGFKVVTIAIAYAIFWAAGVAVAALYAFARA